MAGLFVVFSLIASASGCTNIAYGKGATADGSTIVACSADASKLDFRMAYIPAQDHPKGSKRPVYKIGGYYPRFVNRRSKTYTPTTINGVIQNVSVPLGFIPQVSHTYGYWENHYPFMNEKGLAFCETTTLGRIPGVARDQGGTALFYVDALMQIALERCSEARCAIATMGYWAESGGFYGESPTPSDSGEVLSIADGSEAWVFHIMADFDGGAVWAAQRVPDHHIAVAANNFIIRGIDFNDHAHRNFIWSKGILGTAQALVNKGRIESSCSKAATFDFLKCFGGDIRVDWYDPGWGAKGLVDPWYTTLRMWRVQERFAPSLGFGRPTDNPFSLPFSFPVDKPVTALEAMDMMRDQMEGTEFDLTKGALAGPFGDPNRNEKGEGLEQVPGYFARAISLLRTSYAVVCQSKRNATNIAWVAMHQPATSVFVPFFSASTSCHESYSRGSQFEYDEMSAWWAFSFVSNWMRLNWRNMSKTYVFPKIRQLQAEVVDRAANFNHDITAEQVALQGQVVEEWKRLGRFLIMAYNNGYINFPNLAQGCGYPAEWLKSIGFHATILPLYVQPGLSGIVQTEPKATGLLAPETTASVTPRTLVLLAGGFLAGVTIGGTIVALMLFKINFKSRSCVDSHYSPLAGT